MPAAVHQRQAGRIFTQLLGQFGAVGHLGGEDANIAGNALGGLAGIVAGQPQLGGADALLDEIGDAGDCHHGARPAVDVGENRAADIDLVGAIDDIGIGHGGEDVHAMLLEAAAEADEVVELPRGGVACGV